jgi:hypothetical protein
LSAVFENLDRESLVIAFAGLERIGATTAASLMARACADDGGGSVEEIEAELARSKIAAIRLEAPEQYAVAHPKEFPGPRSLTELWESMQKRGVTEKPERLIEFERLAEDDARSTDQRCAMCGQPVPTYKKKCRRCGRPYVRRVE